MRAAQSLPHRPAGPAAGRWISPPARPPSPDWLRLCDGNAILAALLQARGLSLEQAQEALVAPAAPADPYLLADMEAAVERLRAAAARRERCVVYGDYDCDGLTGGTVLGEGLRALGLPVNLRVPDRRRDGYGLAVRHVEEVAAEGVRLLVTVDCGSTSTEALAWAAARGIDVVVADHHPPPTPLPPAVALINPRRPDDRYPEKDLCGAGVAHALLRALVRVAPALDPDAGLDLVALGTIADVVPLRGENRALVRRGLPLLARAARPGVRALIEQSGVSRLTLSARDVAFGLAPRLNAAGRLDDAGRALALLAARRPRDARAPAFELETLNTRRQALTRDATAEAVARVEELPEIPSCLVVWDAAWHPGVVGLVAARLVERYYRPSVVLGYQDGRWRGSARSIPCFDIGAALLQACAGLLLRAGGHAMAAGLEAADDSALVSLRERLQEKVRSCLGSEVHPPRLRVDLSLPADQLDWQLAEAALALQPCGAGWPEPLVAVHDVVVLDVSGEGGALRLTVAGRGGMAVVARARREVLPAGAVAVGDRLTLAAIPTVRDRHGYRCLELAVVDAYRRGGTTRPQPPESLLRV